MDQVHAGHLLQHFECQVPYLPIALGCVGELAGIGPLIGDEPRHVVERQVAAPEHHGRILGEHAHWRECARIETEVFVEKMRHAETPLRRTQEGVAVGGRLEDVFGADIAAGAGAVLDNERLAQGGLQLLRHHPCQGIGGAARRDGNDDRHGPCRIRRLRRRASRPEGEEQGQACGDRCRSKHARHLLCDQPAYRFAGLPPTVTPDHFSMCVISAVKS